MQKCKKYRKTAEIMVLIDAVFAFLCGKCQFGHFAQNVVAQNCKNNTNLCVSVRSVRV